MMTALQEAGGAIVNILSNAALTPIPGQAAYSASTPDEQASVVAFLCWPGASFIVGAAIPWTGADGWVEPW